MRTKFVFLILVFMFSFAMCAIAAENTDANAEITSPKQARHLIIPFIGYQTLDGEEVGYTYSTTYFERVGNSIDSFYVERNGSSERNVTIPELGISYRYMPLDLLHAELSLSTIHDKVHLEYPVRYEQQGYTVRRQVLVERKQTSLSTMSLILNIPDVWDWLRSSLKVSGGYAWRVIDYEAGQGREAIGVTDSKELYVARAGLDLSYWSGKNFLLETSISYSAFIPTSGENASFGGLGWRISVFPIWNGVRG
ncbi:MAG: hypothetical protein HN356_06400 [Calditrichaeota bacterium]|nr:hypothetical protein [Calditrichota bacterium]MBT7616994.1 hypothetical protein [Calditrichota bacterium]MBT7787716.1 hypothetical protein [Calditrichota bacterium]